MAEKIVFFHMNQLGDLLFSLPLLAAARRADAAASAVSVIRAPLAPLLEATGLVDRVIVKHRGASAFVRRISALRREGFSRAVLFSESPESLVAAYCSGIPARYGFRTASLGFLLTRSAGRTGVPSLGNNRALAAELGLRDCPADYTGLVKIPAERVEAQRRWCGAEGIDPACLVVVAPGASRRRKDKCWPEASWAVLLELMRGKGLVPVLCGAPSEKADLECLACGVSPQVRVFTAPDGILSMAALMGLARLFVGIDSGAMHLAASLNVPVVALFGATDPRQIGPQPLAQHRVLKQYPIDLIRPADVFAVVMERLERGRS